MHRAYAMEKNEAPFPFVSIFIALWLATKVGVHIFQTTNTFFLVFGVIVYWSAKFVQKATNQPLQSFKTGEHETMTQGNTTVNLLLTKRNL